MRDFRSGRDRDSDGGQGGGWGIAAGKQTLSEAAAPAWGEGETAAASSVSAAGRALQRMVAEAGRAPAAEPSAAVRGEVAARGVEGATGALPHHETIQRSFGKHSLDGIGVAQGGAASEAAEQLGAKAYTFGRRISLGRGSGLRVQAHEATHALQQRAGKVSGHGEEGDAHEVAAEAVADQVERGESAEALLDELLGPEAAGSQGQGGGGEAVQCLSMTSAEVPTKFGVPLGHALLTHEHYRALLDAFQSYEVPDAPPLEGAPVATPSQIAAEKLPRIAGLLEAAKRFRRELDDILAELPAPAPVGGGVGAPAPPALSDKRMKGHLATIIGELYKEQDAQLRAAAADGTQRTPEGDRALTPQERITKATSHLADKDSRGKETWILRYRQRLGFVGQRKDAVTDADGPVILQSWRARGDMYHVGAVMNLFPRLKVIIYDLPEPSSSVTNEQTHDKAEDHGERWKQAVMISEYYGQADRVFYTHANDVSPRAGKGDAYEFHQGIVSEKPPDQQRNLFIDVGGCTTIIGLEMERARKGQTYGQAKARLAAAVAPDPKDGEDRASRQEIVGFLESKGWDRGENYVIINYRGSGHAQIEKQIHGMPKSAKRQKLINKYNPATDQEGGNHPDLDTGVVGVQQLADLVRARGYVPVFMGEEPANAEQPHLIKYWEFKHDYTPPAKPEDVAPPVERKNLSLCRGGRAAEAFFIRALAEVFDVRLLAMRSGVTDQLAFLGIPTLSIDVDNFHQAAAPQLLDKPAYEDPSDAVAHSWARGGKLEAGLERDYGRVFIEQPRELKSISDDGKWKGKFGEKDLSTIGDALDFYFGEPEQGAPESNGVRHKSHPLHPDKLKATSDKSGAIDRQMRKALPGKIDTNLNPDVVLAHARAVLQAEPPNIAEAKKFLDSHLTYTRVDQRSATPADAEFKAKKLQDQLAFLREATAVMREVDGEGPYVLERTAIEKGLLDNQRRLAVVPGPVQAVLPLRAKVEHALLRRIDPTDGAMVRERADFAKVPLVAPVEKAIADARAVVAVEDAAAFHARLTSIITTVTEIFTKLAALCKGVTGSSKKLFYRKPFDEIVELFGDDQKPNIALPE